MRGIRVLLPVLLVALVVAAVASVLSARPDLQQARRKVDASWTALEPTLAQRYTLLANAAKQTRSIAGPIRQVTNDVNAGLARWQSVEGRGSVGEQVVAANDLEALGRRLLVTAAVSPRVAGDGPAQQALQAYLADRAYTTAGAFNATVAAYEHERNGPVRQVVAKMLGDGNIPALDTTPLTL